MVSKMMEAIIIFGIVTVTVSVVKNRITLFICNEPLKRVAVVSRHRNRCKARELAFKCDSFME